MRLVKACLSICRKETEEQSYFLGKLDIITKKQKVFSGRTLIFLMINFYSGRRLTSRGHWEYRSLALYHLRLRLTNLSMGPNGSQAVNGHNTVD